MAAHASITDLEARWKPLDTDERATAGVLLEDAAVQLRRDVPGLQAAIDGGDADLMRTTIRVECSMVRRAMAVSDGAYGVASLQETTGPFSHQFTYTNPTGDLYVTKAERRLLGAGGQRAFTIDTAPAEPVHHFPDLLW